MACASISLGLVLLLALCCTATMVRGREWIVGDDKGWSFGVSGWEKGKTFQRLDVLVFNYDPKMHNVVEVTEEEYKSCEAIVGPHRKFTSGHDRILLIGTGASYVCGIPGHCNKGMKIDITIE